MDQDIRLGTIDGIPIGVNWSILVVFLLITWELADLVLPGYYRSGSTAAYWLVGFVTTVLFFISLLAHEVSHAVVAKRNGVGVRRITLWLFGGISELEGDALKPGADFRIAVIGPVTSLVFAGLFAGLGAVVHHVGGAGLMVPALGWLGWMNVLLGVFNLIPAAPLDGGRVLRAILWRRSGDRVRAATTATRCGQAFAYLLVVLGVLEFLAVGLAGVWFAFLGWYLLMAARAEENSIILRSSLGSVHVRDVMTPNPVTFDSTATVADLIDNQLHLYRFGSFPLTGRNGALVGLTTIGRIHHVSPDLRSTTRLIDIACPLFEVPTGAPGEPVPDLLSRMQASPDGRALVIDEKGALVGIVSPSDIARFVQLSLLQSQFRSTRRN